jgi:hypothetical protein
MVKRATWPRLAPAAAIALALLGCESKEIARTQIMLVVDSDLTVPSELDQIDMYIDGPSGKRQQASALLSESPLPRSLALVRTEGPLSPLIVRVSGMLAGGVVVERSASLAFVEGRTLVLPMHLARSCIEMSCGEQTCTERGCEDVAVEPSSLSEWDGEEPTLRPGPGETEPDGGMTDDEDSGMSADASTPGVDGGRDASVSSDASRDAQTPPRDSGSDGGRTDAGSCTPQAESCNQRDDDCDGTIDDGIDLMTDESNCGFCGNTCGSGRVCCSGMCRRSC